MQQAPGWTCTDCGRSFRRVNQRHVCGAVTLDSHFAGQDPALREIFDRFEAAVGACGPFDIAVTKSQIAFRGTARVFAGVWPLRGRLEGWLTLTRPLLAPRFQGGPYQKSLFINRFRLASVEDVDDELAVLVGEAYRDVGEGAYKTRSRQAESPS